LIWCISLQQKHRRKKKEKEKEKEESKNKETIISLPQQLCKQLV
jgi:hypothetical protein